MDFEQTATSVKRGEPPASAFAPPAGITFQDDTNLAKPRLHGPRVRQLPGEPAAGRLDRQGQGGDGQAADGEHREQLQRREQPRELTPEEKAQQRQACEALKNFDLGKTMANAGKSVVSEALNEAVQEKKAEAKNDAKNKIKGLFKKPHL